MNTIAALIYSISIIPAQTTLEPNAVSQFEILQNEHSYALTVTQSYLSNKIFIGFRKIGSERDTSGNILLIAERVTLNGDLLERQSTDSRSCMNLWSVLSSADAIDVPDIHLPTPEPTDVIQLDVNPDEPLTNDAIYTLRSQARFMPGNWSADIEFSGGSLSPLGNWVQSVETATNPCWKGQ